MSEAPSSSSTLADSQPARNRVPAHTYFDLFMVLAYAFKTGKDQDFAAIDDYLRKALDIAEPNNKFREMEAIVENMKKSVARKEAKLDDLIGRLLVRAVEMNVATDAEIAAVLESRKNKKASKDA